MQEQFSVVGKSVPKVDAVAKVTGRAKYAGDLKFPGMLVGKLLLSPYAHARIVSIDTSEAEKLPGVKAVITHKDVPDLPYGISPARWDENIFCIDKVRYVGDKVAAVAAVDEETCHRALSLIKVEYEELPAVFDPIEAMQEGAPQIHDRYPRNINVEIHQSFGDVEKALAEAYYVRTDRFVGQRAHHAMLEPHCSIAVWEGNRLTLWSSTQSPHYFQYYLARQFGLKMSDVRVIKTYLGGGFGGKLEPGGLEFAGAVLARITGRPVKMFYDRHEMFLYGRGRHRNYMELTTGVTKDGKILAVHANFVMDGGAYTGLGIATAYYTGALLPLVYEFENFRFDMLRVCTNLPPCGPQRGHGGPQPRWAFESQLDMIARELGIDPMEIRKRNARRSRTITCNSLQVNTCELVACIEKAKEISKWDDKKKAAKGRGIGCSCSLFVSGAGYPIYRTDLPQAAATIKVSEDGTGVTLYTGAVDLGQGSDTVLAQMAAESIGVPFDAVKVVSADTELAPHDFGAYASRQTLMSGWAVKRAGEEVKRKVLEMAAKMMGLVPDDLDCKEGVIFEKEEPGHSLSFATVARQYFVEHGPLIGTGSYTPPKLGGDFKGAAVGTSPAYSATAQVAEVEVDEETGEVKVLDFYDVHDSGTVVNPLLFHAQVHGALSMAVGEALMEEVHFDQNGRVINANLADYRIPTSLDVPAIHSETVESFEPAGPWGVKEVGEGATVGALGCLANAIADAIGVHVTQLPMSPERVWRALQQRSKATQAEKKGE